MANRLLLSSAFAAALILAPPVAIVAADAKTTDSSPDVLLLTVDTLRPDALGWVAGKNATPALDALARSGASFRSAISPVPLTLPAHVSILTGVLPGRHGVHDNGRTFPPTGGATLAERFAAAGYDTAAFVSGFPLAARFGLDRGFARYDDAFDAGVAGRSERKAGRTVDAALAWARGSRAPRFLWVHLYDPHDPYEGAADDSPAAQRAAYDGEVRSVDAAVARLLAALPDPGGRGRVTVFAADHGESLGEHGEATHGFFVYQSTVEVPLVISFPGRVAPRDLSERARLIDLAPTVLDLAGRKALGPIDGVSLAALLAGRPQALPPAIVESRRPWYSYGWAPLAAIVDRGWKLVSAPRPELFDLARDPDESRDLVNSERREARRLEALLREAGKLPASVAAPPDVEAAGQLRALGYVGGNAEEDVPVSGLADPKDRVATWNRLGEAERALETGRPAEALAGFDAALVDDPANPFALARSADALVALGRRDEAERRLRAAIARAPRQAEIRRSLAALLLRSRRFDESAREWRTLAEQSPRDAAAWSGLGTALGMSGRPREAVAAFDRAVAASPEDPEVRVRTAFAAVAAGDKPRAIAELAKAADLEPAAFGHAGALGILLDDVGRSAEAAAWLARSAPGDGDFAEARFRLARLRLAEGRRDEAAAELNRAIAADPGLGARARADAGLAALFESPY